MVITAMVSPFPFGLPRHRIGILRRRIRRVSARRTRGPQCGVCIVGLRLRKPVLLYYSTEKKDLQGFLPKFSKKPRAGWYRRAALRISGKDERFQKAEIGQRQRCDFGR